MEKERNYARFYCLLKKLLGADKETLVYQYTNGRTVHLHETTLQEYGRMCRDMEQVAGFDERREAIREEFRRKRSVCLKLMQRLGIDTASWGRVNAFCLDPRIAGMEFRRLDGEDLDSLAVKLRKIARKGGLKAVKEPRPSGREVIVYPIFNNMTES